MRASTAIAIAVVLAMIALVIWWVVQPDTVHALFMRSFRGWRR